MLPNSNWSHRRAAAQLQALGRRNGRRPGASNEDARSTLRCMCGSCNKVFASKYPKAVAGLVLLDPPPLSFIMGQGWAELRGMAERMTTEWQAIADSAAESADVQEKAKAAFFRMIASEHREMFGRTSKLVSAISTFGDKPLVVIASGKPNPAFGEAAERFQQYWVEQNRTLTGKSTHGKFILAEAASHFLYVDAPELVDRTNELYSGHAILRDGSA